MRATSLLVWGIIGLFLVLGFGYADLDLLAHQGVLPTSLVNVLNPLALIVVIGVVVACAWQTGRQTRR